ncbi:MAG: ROK family transcriptional regulator [Spirochaetaceae bacterium]|nr:ROK family transcriptional regulator [Spirochaetaceae bacterium]
MLIKNSNAISRILQIIWQEEAVNRTAIADLVGLNKSTITKILTPLIEDGIIISKDKLASGEKGGRKAEVLAVNENFGYVIGVEINTDFTIFCVTDLKGKIIFEKIFNSESYSSFQDLINQSILKAVNLCKNRDLPILGISFGIPGPINPFEGIVYRSDPLGVHSPVKIYNGTSDYPFPVLIENDANCCCYNHLLKNKNNRENNFLTILGEFRKSQIDFNAEGGIAIGLGIYCNGDITHGKDYTAGEFQSLFKSRHNFSQFDLTIEETKKLPENENLVKKVLMELSTNLALLINSMNLSQIIFTGNITEYQYMLLPFLRNEIQKNWNHNSQVSCNIVFDEEGNSTVAHGAACNFINKLFSPAKMWIKNNDYYPSGIEFYEFIQSIKTD